MEVTTVSPSPASPTEGDDLCEIDVTDVAIHSVTLLICLCGLSGNGAVLWLLRLRARNSAIFQLSFIDFLFLLLMVPSAFLFLVEDMSCSPVMPLTYVSFLFQLSVISFNWGLHRLTRLSSLFYVLKQCELYCRCRPPERLLWVVISVRDWAFFALFTVIPTLASLCPSHEQEQCRAALISIYTIILLLFVATMFISRTIDIIKATCGSKKQQDKKRHITISVVVLLTILLSMWNFLQHLGYFLVPTQVVFLLTCIHSSIKPFIYFLAGRCWSPCSMESLQLSLQRVFEEKEEITACRNDANTDTVV
ncbi:mas-related G-protein coupled receptor member H-like [Oenanthe melanoleuca]|uniref:mas-related G-protein coupled receptor member H-like n=1 Tax=Oenanthe melanoleuca TaxID=2939378 RepID=UPI0024C13C9D|nr:mas-related G-protein coupled receptor member H-like [Oenanthe melanoleuca]XP_056348009.1 mas-related G-protein coupled receptor member H-like [Oenanthe melanoleuca]XP_056348010.1 mas-related G-protein coupled receptor member H-like [Oenanthe melanoleuca]XP_056348011.1 mas-related G-protein coupled receptor member H-like [Oenanthe melanoleuca]XP_056348012.1 mas-related G-protein coupled receptor member H-like [Oenanthe melanoleuca]